jgi:hypothetical protein
MPGNPIQELMAMVGGGGGGGAPPMAGGGGGPPPGMPPAMDAAMGQRTGGMGMEMGNFVGQAIQKLMQNPQAMAAIGSVLSDVAGPQNDPRINTGGPQLASLNPQDMMEYQATQSGMPQPDDVLATAPMGTEGAVGNGIPSTEEEMEAVNRDMGGDGAEPAWSGGKAPTQDDIDLLMEDPAKYAESFDAHFGAGSADRYLAEDNEEADGDVEEDDPY